MKPGPILLFVVLAVGGGYLLYQTNRSAPAADAPQAGQAPAAVPAKGTAAALSSDEAAQARASGAGNSSANASSQPDPIAKRWEETRANTPAPTEAESESDMPKDADGSLPSVRPAPRPAADERELNERYANATSGELMSAYQALNDYYQMHFDGRITDKSERLAPEALEALQREMAWLKERAINGKPDSDG